MLRWFACLVFSQVVFASSPDPIGVNAALRGGVQEDIGTELFSLNLFSHGDAAPQDDATAGADVAAEADVAADADDDAAAAEPDYDVPEADTTVLPPDAEANSPQSIAVRIMQVINAQLHQEKYQWVNPLLAFVFGGIMVVNGEACFKWLLAASMFICVGVLTASDLGKLWPQGDDFPVIRNIVAVEAGLIAGFATLRGIHGVVVVLGAIIGACIAYSVESTLTASQDEHFLHTAWWPLFLYTLSVAVSVWFFQRKLCKTLAVVSALTGSALVVSAGLWLVTELVARKKLYLGSLVTPVTGAWVDFLRFLINSSVEDRGIFAKSQFDFTVFGAHFSLDRILGFGLWLVVFVAGLQIQLKVMGCGAAAKKAKVVEARGLTARLLPSSS